jgi:haloalkane dehalogenase
MESSARSPDLATAALSKRDWFVDGKRMAFHERGHGDAIVFLHGNPTSSYLWRNVLPYVADQGRCIVPDLIGHGDSDKLDDVGPTSYGFVEHRHYLDGLLDQLELGDRVTLVLHDWGSALGFDWARRHPERVAGIAYMEAFVRPLTWDEWPEVARPIFQALRSDAGEELILDRNLFVERVLPGGMIRDLAEEEMAEYRRPFAAPGEDRRPTLSWPRQLPIDGEPAEVVEIVGAYARWMAQTEIPKLFVNADPGGANLAGAQREFCRSWPNQSEVTVPGIHYIQEDSPDLVGVALARWLAKAVHGDAPPGDDAGSEEHDLGSDPEGG